MKKLLSPIITLFLLGIILILLLKISEKYSDSIPQLSATPLQKEKTTWSIGYSVEGREIRVYRWGEGPVKVVLVGGIHGGYEINTIKLARKAVEYFDVHQEEIPSNVELYIIPSLNPDGDKRGSRLNANEVDLNRNWDCKWTANAKYRGKPVNPGKMPFSEPETAALKSFVDQESIDAVIFLHSAYGSVSVGVCSENTKLAQKMGREYAEAAGYKFFGWGAFYPITGDGTGYFNSIGIPSIEIELTDHKHIEWNKNHKGLLAVLRWASANLN